MQPPQQPARQATDRSLLSSPSWWQRNGSVVTLLLLAPVVSEVLYGSTRVSAIPALVPEIMCWGCGALLIRHFTRRWQKGWTSMMLMGLALAVAEEFVIQQTSIAPMVTVAQQPYGRVFGVNWVYFEWALFYECAWVVLIPVQLTELLFPAQRRKAWLGARGVAIASLFFVLGSFMAWYSWTQRVRVQILHMAPYTPSPQHILAGIAAIILLVVGAYLVPAPAKPAESRPAPPPWFAGIVTGVLGTAWSAFALISWGPGALPHLPYLWPLTVGLGWAACAFFLVRRWTASSGWSDWHRYALVLAGVAATMIGGVVFFAVDGASRLDWIGKSVLNLAAVAWLIWIGRAAKWRQSA